MTFARLRIAPVLAIALLISACTLAQIVQVINAAVLIAEQAAAITGTGIPPAYLAYVSAASNCIAFAATEQAGTDPAAVKGTKITEACSRFTSAALPPGTAQKYVDMAGKLAKAIQDILLKLPVSSQSATNAPAKPDVMSANDVAALHKLADRAQAALAKVERRP